MRLVTLDVGAARSPRSRPAGLLVAHRGVRVLIDGGRTPHPRAGLMPGFSRLSAPSSPRRSARGRGCCALRGGPSPLQQAVERAVVATSWERICAVVATEHRSWWSEQLGSVRADNIFVQPNNRGTANGILFAHILDRDTAARIVLLPSDHHVFAGSGSQIRAGHPSSSLARTRRILGTYDCECLPSRRGLRVHGSSAGETTVCTPAVRTRPFRSALFGCRAERAQRGDN